MNGVTVSDKALHAISRPDQIETRLAMFDFVDGVPTDRTPHPTRSHSTLAFAVGAILTMLADTLMPEAYEHAAKLVGVATTLGFAVAFTIHTLD